MRVRFESPYRPHADHVTTDLPTPPREGEWVSLGDEDDQQAVRTVVWHVDAEDANATWVQVILGG